MKTAFLFPGQGAQTVGMGEDLYAENTAYKTTFDQIDAALPIDLKAACFNGDNMEKSEYIQPAIYAHSLSLLAALGETADIYAGLSLGEYSALAATGILDIAEGAVLVNRRGAIMDEAVPIGVGAMLSVMGLKIDEIEAMIDGKPDIWAANHLSETQIVLGGGKSELETIEQMFIDAGAKTVFINVSGPFHTPMLKEASDTLRGLLNTIDLKKPNAIIYSNFTGLPYDENSDVVEMLTNQMCSRVRWFDTTEALIKQGVKNVVEIGPSMVLSKMLKRQLKGEDINIASVRDLKSLNKYLASKGEVK